MYLGDRWLRVRKQGKWRFILTRGLLFYGGAFFLFLLLTAPPGTTTLDRLGFAGFAALGGCLAGGSIWLFCEWLYPPDKSSSPKK